MTLTERIAKRKAEGWEVACWVVKGGFDSGLYLDARGMCWGSRPYAGRFPSKEAAESTARIGDETKCCATPVFTRTIKRPRAYSFWQACKMVMAGKKMRQVSGNGSTIERSCGGVVWSYGSGLSVCADNISARWELAE